MICFPVLRNVKIRNYQLYSNEHSDGIEHSFFGGVHLIVGINGLGKTTLLNAIYRLLVGPNDAPKGGEKNLGSSKNELTGWRRRKFFSSRVKDGALDATIEGTIGFGGRRIKVKRKLSNLEIVSLSIDDVDIDASQKIYEDKVEELSGLPSFVDFYSVVKFLVFFLEDRTDLIWDHMSQFEMFRILFFDKNSAKLAAEYRDGARSADSNYRNLLASVNKIKVELDQLTSEETEINRKNYASAQAGLSGIELRLAELNDEYSENSAEITKIRVKIAQSQRSFDEYKFGIEEAQHSLLSKNFPSLNDTIKILLSNLSSGGGCFVCGNESKSTYNVIADSLEHKCCPVCHSEENFQESYENVVNENESEKSEAKIEILHKKSKECLKEYDNNKSILAELYIKQDTLLEQIRLTSEERIFWYRKVSIIEKSLPSEDSTTEELIKQLRSWQGMLQQYDDIRVSKTKAYRREIELQEEDLKKKLQLLKKKFEYYCSRLLAETVMLDLDYFEGPLGQGGKEKVKTPYFKVKMTSGVHTEHPEFRESEEQVSESQREFIDLAFRLSLIDVVTESDNLPAMVVMETPEASLDSIFMHEISRLFRSFGDKNDGKNVFLASTNLNQSSMISSLLGVDDMPDHIEQNRKQRLFGQAGNVKYEMPPLSIIEVDDRKNHIINLLELSAPNAALVNYRDYYEKLFKNAVYPEAASEEN
ncbi:AAA family ATPase [Shewanella algae]|uniref:AAA family ATPase n=1 Tax=Shewanella algae TaxID=38313 RepID=UPI0031F51026